jgi:hypothetical protein
MEVLTAYFILFCALCISQVITIALLIQMRQKHMDHAGGVFREGQAKTHSIIHKAIQQANKILVAAELKGLQLLSTQKMSGNELSEHFKAHLDSIEKALEGHLDRSAKEADATYGAFIKSAETSINDHIRQNQKMLEEKAQAMIEKTESLLTNFTADLEAKVKGDVEKELQAATAEIEEYKKNRMRVIDERIVDILEDVLKVALDKKLTLADHSELIYKSLEDAKREHAFSSQSKK